MPRTLRLLAIAFLSAATAGSAFGQGSPMPRPVLMGGPTSDPEKDSIGYAPLGPANAPDPSCGDMSRSATDAAPVGSVAGGP